MELYKLINSFCKNHPDIEGYALKTLFMSDPTFKETNRGLFVGKYGVWIGNMYANGGIKLGDIPELKAALNTYDKNKSQLSQINDCKSLSELIEWVKELSDDFKPVRKQSNAKENLEKVYEDNEWLVYVPHSHAAARRGGEGTHWCTASENDYYYNYYSKQGPLYINIRKSDGAKFQFYFESSQFMDTNDKPVRLNEIGLSEGVVSFYSNIDPKFKFRLKFDLIEDFKEGFATVELNDKYNFINIEGKLLSKQWFDDTYDFHEGFAKVYLNNKWNFINTEGLFLSNQWFDAAGNFKEGFARVKLNDKYNFINTEGRLLTKQWFDAVKNFNDGFARIRINNKRNFINTKGRILSKQWFDAMCNFNDGFSKVRLNGQYNFINTNGQLLSQQWFDDIFEFNNYFASVQLYSKLKSIDTNGKFFEY